METKHPAHVIQTKSQQQTVANVKMNQYQMTMVSIAAIKVLKIIVLTNQLVPVHLECS